MTQVIGHGRYARSVYPTGPGAGGGSSGGVPLSRQRFIDGDTETDGRTGSAAQPFKTIAEFIASRTNSSVADATANYVGWLMPSLLGYTENISFLPYASTELRADSVSDVAGSGTIITGNLTWANVGGANAANPPAIVSVHNITVVGTVSITDDSGAPTSAFLFGGDELGGRSVVLTGGIDSSTTTKLSSIAITNALTGAILAGTSANSAAVDLESSTCGGTLSALSLTAANSIIGFTAIATGAGGTAKFTNCQFIAGSNPVLTCLGGATFDGPSWRSFVEAGGTRATGTVVLVVGGYGGAPVEGAALAAASTSVALNGTGATAGFTGEHSGNHYSTASVTPTSVTILTAGALVGDTVLISRTASVAANLAVINGGVGAGTIGTIPTGSRGFVEAQFNGTNWIFTRGGSLAA